MLAIASDNLEPFLPSSNNTISWNTFDSYAATNFTIYSSSGTIDNPKGDILIAWWGTLEAWKTLTIKEWNIIKVAAWYWITIQWNLQAIWTSDKNIIFTSANDNSVWDDFSALWYSSPAVWDWEYLYFDSAWSNSSILDYVQLKYNWYGGSPSIIYNGSNATLKNSLIALWWWDWILNNNSSPSISNTIITYNTNYWINCISWSPTIKYNLFYQNGSWDQTGCTYGAWVLTGTNPQFVTGTFTLQAISPAINAWDPALWNHPLTSDAYDIWVSEYTNMSVVWYTATITNPEAKTLTYTWSFTADPSTWNDLPVLTNDTWTVTTSETINTSFVVQYIGSYTINLLIKEGVVEVLNKSSNFTVVN